MLVACLAVLLTWWMPIEDRRTSDCFVEVVWTNGESGITASQTCGGVVVDVRKVAAIEATYGAAG